MCSDWRYRCLSLAAAGLLASAVVLPTAAFAQGWGRGGRRGASGERGDRPAYGERRDGPSARAWGDRGDQPAAGDNAGHRRGLGRDFTRSGEGRRFDHGIMLRPAAPQADGHLNSFFRNGVHSYPHYSPAVRPAPGAFISPFFHYHATRPPYIEGRYVHHSAPARIFIETPLYVGGVWHGYRGWRDGYYGGGYYLDRDTLWRERWDLREAIYDLEDGFRDEDISLLASLTDSQTRIAIFSRGEYQYSLDANDYLDMTRDFMRTVDTTGFDVTRVHRRAADVYQVFATHSYRNDDGESQVVHLCIVMERVAGHWTITQIDSSPDQSD